MSKLARFQEEASQEDSRPQESSQVEAKNASAINNGNGPILASPTDDGGNFLKSFLNATPFFDLFEYVADHTCNGKTITIKIAKLKTIHPNFYNTCITLDIVVRAVVVIILIVIAALAAAKVVS